MPEIAVKSLIMKASKDRWLLRFGIALVFLIGSLLGDFPRTSFFFVFRILMVPVCLFAMAVFLTAVLTNRYDLILSPEGIAFGSFYGKQHFKWSEIKSAGIIRPLTGTRVFIELRNPPPSANSGRLVLRYLPDNYGMEPDELAKTLVRWQHEHGNVENN